MSIPYGRDYDDEPPEPLCEIKSGDWLDGQDFPPLRYVVPGLIAEGLAILVGAPKLGKSWLALALALAVAAGGKALGCIPVGNARPVLYLALEDGWRRLQFRSRQLLGVDENGEPHRIPDKLEFIIKGDRLALKAAIIEWLNVHHDEQPLVLVDTLAKLRPPTSRSDNAYDADYKFVGDLKNIIDEIPGGAMVLVHHTNKRADGDFLDAVSGTQGIAGAADSTITLRRSRQEQSATLSVTGRDVVEDEYAITSTDGMWKLDGNGLQQSSALATENRKIDNVGDRMADVVKFVNGRTETKAADLAGHLGIPSDQARKYLSRANESGRIGKSGLGVYRGVSPVPGVPDLEQASDTVPPTVPPLVLSTWDETPGTPGTLPVIDPPTQPVVRTPGRQPGQWLGSGQPVIQANSCPSCAAPLGSTGKCVPCLVGGLNRAAVS